MIAAGLMEEVLAIVNVPDAEPAVVGSNCTYKVVDCPGFSVAGKAPPERVKPVPVIAAEFTVTGSNPVDVRVTACVAGVFKFTFPKVRLVALIESVGTDAFNCKLKLCEAPVVLAVSTAVWELVTGEAIAVNDALVALAGTIIDAGSVTALELLAKATARPPAGAVEFKVTEQVSVPLPVIALATQLNFFTCETAFAVSLIFLFEFVVEFELSVSCPIAVPDDFGSNWTVMIAV